MAHQRSQANKRLDKHWYSGHLALHSVLLANNIKTTNNNKILLGSSSILVLFLCVEVQALIDIRIVQTNKGVRMSTSQEVSWILKLEKWHKTMYRTSSLGGVCTLSLKKRLIKINTYFLSLFLTIYTLKMSGLQRKNSQQIIIYWVVLHPSAVLQSFFFKKAYSRTLARSTLKYLQIQDQHITFRLKIARSSK